MAPNGLASFIPRDSPLGRAGGANMLLRVTGGNYAGAAALAAIARKESEFGRTSGRFVNNPYGWGVHLSSAVNTAPDIETMTRRVWKGLNSDLYKGAGINTVPSILNRYAPPNENNTELYKQQTSSWLRQMGVDPSTNIFAPGRQGAARVTPTSQAAPSATRPGGRRAGPAGGAPTRAAGVSPDAAALVLQYARDSEADVMAGRAPRDIDPILPELAAAVKRSMPTGAPPAAGRDVALDGIRQVGRPADPSDNQVVNAAKAYLGTPYSWGGGTPSGPTRGFAQGANTVGFDCSSLVQMAWAKKGVKLPRTTYEQIKVGQPVANIGQAQPGDLLFPSTGHVQMYIGNGKVIEAPRTGGRVQIVPARAKYIAIRRPG